MEKDAQNSNEFEYIQKTFELFTDRNQQSYRVTIEQIECMQTSCGGNKLLFSEIKKIELTWNNNKF